MWSQMVNSWPSTFVHSLQEGVQKADRENYAFITHAPVAEYFANKQPCDFYTTEEFLNTQYYAFALRHNRSARLRQSLNEQINAMRDTGQIQELYEKWWRNECDRKRDIDVDTATVKTANAPWRYVTATRKFETLNSASNNRHNLYHITIVLTILLVVLKLV
jgi:hypothetical protein